MGVRDGAEEYSEYRGADGTMVAGMLADRMHDALSAVYSFFEPRLQQRSLGTYMILEHIEYTRRLGLPYLYLGYWISGSRKMSYKTRFVPQEHLGPNGWERVEP